MLILSLLVVITIMSCKKYDDSELQINKKYVVVPKYVK